MSKMSKKKEINDSCKHIKYQNILVRSKDEICEDIPFPSVTSIDSCKPKSIRNLLNKLKPKPLDENSLKTHVFKFVPDKIHFSDYKSGKVYKRIIKSTNNSSKISRITIIPPKSKVFSVSIFTGSQHQEHNVQHETKNEKDADCCTRKITKYDCLLRDGAWAAAPGTCVYIAVLFSPANEHGDVSKLVLKIQGGDDVIIPLSALNNPPILDGYVIGGPLYRVPSRLTWNSRFDEEQVDIVEVGTALLGGESGRELVIHNQGGKASFFIVLEETWIRSRFQDISLDNKLVAPPYTIWPVHFFLDNKGTAKLQMRFKPHCPCISCPYGHACRGCAMCSQCKNNHQCNERPELHSHDTAQGCSAFGLHVERLAIVCTNGIVRYIHLFGDGIQFPKKPLHIKLPNKIYDIDTDGDSLCQYFLDLGVIFPNNTCKIEFDVQNLSAIPFEIRWVWRQSNSTNRAPWPHGETGWCQDRCGGFCSNCCGGLCVQTLNGGILEPETSFPVNSEIMSEDFPPGKYSAVIGLIIMDIPETCLPQDFSMKRFITTKYSMQDLESNYMMEKYDILAYEIEVWLEIKLPEVFLNPCLIQLLSEPLSQSSTVVQKDVAVHNLSEKCIEAHWKIEEINDKTMPMQIVPENFTIAPGEDFVCNFFITVISGPQIVEEIIVLDINCGLLQKELIIHIDVATPSTQLVPFRNTRVECLKRSDVLGPPPYVAPLAILSLPDVLYVSIHQVVSVVLRNTTPITMEYKWGKPIDISDDGFSSSNIDYESIKDRKLYLFTEEFTPHWNGESEEEGDDYGEDSSVIPDDALLPFISPKLLLPSIFHVPKIEIYQLALNKVVTKTVLIRNKTPIPTFFNVSVTKYPAIYKDSPEDILRKIDAKVNGKSYADIMPEEGAGLGVLTRCSSSQLPPYGIEQVQIEILSDTWGTYADTINIQVEGLAVLPIQLMVQVVEGPLKVAEDLRFGSQLFGGPNVQRYLNVTNTSSVPLLVYWHVFDDEANELYERPGNEAPFSLLLNIGNESTWLEFKSPEPSYEVVQMPESSDTFAVEVKISEPMSVPSSFKSILIKNQLPADGEESSATLLPKKHRSKTSTVVFKTGTSKLMTVEPSLSSNSGEKISNSLKSNILSRPGTPIACTPETAHKKRCSPDEVYRDSVGEEFDDFSSTSSYADNDVKLQLCFTDYCGHSAEDYFVIEPRQMLLSPGETSKLSVTLVTEGNRKENNDFELINVNRLLISNIQCQKHQSDELYRDFPPVSSIILTARLLLPRVIICEAKNGIIFTTHATKLFSSPNGYLRLRKSLVIYNPHELPAAGIIVVGHPFTLNSPENTFNIPPESSYKIKVECTITTAMCLKGCHQYSKQLRMVHVMEILQDRLPNQIINMEIVILFPELKVEPTFIDFGQCSVTDTMVRDFKVENLTDEEMECTVSPGWSCLGAWTVQPVVAVLEPMRCGGVRPAVFTITFTPGMREGPLRTTITVSTPVPHCSFRVQAIGQGVPQVRSEASMQ